MALLYRHSLPRWDAGLTQAGKGTAWQQGEHHASRKEQSSRGAVSIERLCSRAGLRRCSAPHRLGKAQGSQLPLGVEQPQHLMMMNHFCARISIS